MHCYITLHVALATYRAAILFLLHDVVSETMLTNVLSSFISCVFHVEPNRTEPNQQTTNTCTPMNIICDDEAASKKVIFSKSQSKLSTSLARPIFPPPLTRLLSIKLVLKLPLPPHNQQHQSIMHLPRTM